MGRREESLPTPIVSPDGKRVYAGTLNVNNASDGVATQNSYGITIGYQNQIYFDVGNNTEDGIAIGRSCEVRYNPRGIAIGKSAIARAIDAVAIGTDAGVAFACTYSISIGSGPGCNGLNCIAIGRVASAGSSSNPESVAVGNNAVATKGAAAALGYLATAGGDSVAIGWGSQAGAGGNNRTESVAVGANADAIANGSVAIGKNTAVSDLHTASIAIGYRAVSAASQEAVFGQSDGSAYTLKRFYAWSSVSAQKMFHFDEVTGLELQRIGQSLRIKEGANARAGVATLVAGTVTVNTTAVAATSRIHLDGQDAGTGVVGALTVSARTAATSFTILSTSATDDRVIAWWITDPA